MMSLIWSSVGAGPSMKSTSGFSVMRTILSHGVRCKNGHMRATVLHAPRDIRLDDVPDPQLIEDGDEIVRVVASCVCGSDLWSYRGINEVTGARRIGHEFVGIVEQ